MKANRLCIAWTVALPLMACGGMEPAGTELTTVLSTAARRPKEFSAPLSGAAERPNPVPSNGTGSGYVLLDGKKLSVLGSYMDLSTNVTAAHIHGPADENSTGPVLCTLKVPAAVSGTINEGTGAGSCGDLVLSSADVTNLESGKLYINIHNASYPSGEVRGQLRLSPLGSGAGEAKVTLAAKRLKVSGSFMGLDSNAAAAHIHGPADEDSTARVFCTLQVTSSTSGEIREGQGVGSCGDVRLSDAEVADFENGRMYINIHTELRIAGEVRGQLTLKR